MALEMLNGVSGDSEVMVLLAAAKPVIKTPFTGDLAKVRRLIQESRATDEPGDMKEAVLMALSLADRTRGDEIWIVSDGAFDPIDEIASAGKALKFRQVGELSENAGIVQFQIRALLGNPGSYEIMVSIKNFHSTAMAPVLRLYINDSLIVKELIPLDAHEEKTFIYPYEGVIAGKAVAELELEDDFSLDDRVYSVLAGSKKIKVLLLTPGNIFLEKVLSAYPNIAVHKNIDTLDYSPYNMVIVDRISPPPLYEGNYILINTLAPNLPIKASGLIPRPEITSFQKQHPLLDTVNLKEISIEKAIYFSDMRYSESLVNTGNQSLIFVYQRDKLRALHIGFDLLETDLPLRVAFPVLMGNVLRWFYPGSLSASNHIQAGSAYEVSTRANEGYFSVTKPDGSVASFRAEENPCSFQDTSQVGFYTVKTGTTEWDFAVNILSREESDINSRFRLSLPGQDSEPSVLGSEIKMPVWSYFMLLALIILLLDWYFWIRER
ncbi:hypothetical protein ES703_84951 [subsurface metagenome]